MKRSTLAGAGLALSLGLSLTVATTDASAQTPTSPPPSSAAPSSPASPASPPPAVGVNAVRLHVTADKNKGARLYIHRSDGQYTFVCATPCTTDVPVESKMRVTLDTNEDEPHTFTVPGDMGPEIDVRVQPPSVGPLIGGIVTMGAGGVFALSGLLLVALAEAAESSSTSRSSITEDVADTYRVTGYVSIGIGVVAAVVGLIVLTTRSHEPRINGVPHVKTGVYSRADTLLGDMAGLRPRDASTVKPSFTPLTYGFTF